ncbi:unnamed protein product [Owenia fusiformis]|uniref:Uncharacterized protein n=1 Tax=Owenia fusiformis TaxID=6347 RepID=A0A8J1UTJ4_OWEFU|nr:unnamed protein product [Owenia fusiformis]
MKLVILISLIFSFSKCYNSVVVYSGVDQQTQAVTNRLQRIMSNPGINTESKRYLEAALGNINNGVVTALERNMAHPTEHPNGARGRRSVPLHATECCCKVAVPPLRTQKHRTVTRWRDAYRRVRDGSSKCGFWGWKRCTRWRNEHYRISYSHTEPYFVYTPRSCPRDKEVCCRGFMPHKRCCTNVLEMIRLLDLFESQRAQFENNMKKFLVSHGHNPNGQCPKSCGP